jgi:regulator of PEP synthase PpsR (kinase-PPPase family)
MASNRPFVADCALRQLVSATAPSIICLKKNIPTLAGIRIDRKLIEEAKIAAIREKTNVSRVAEELLRGWLSRLKLKR